LISQLKKESSQLFFFILFILKVLNLNFYSGEPASTQASNISILHGSSWDDPGGKGIGVNPASCLIAPRKLGAVDAADAEAKSDIKGVWEPLTWHPVIAHEALRISATSEL